ncbi:MAG: serine/threonine protein kinase [Phycisphaerales bacterium]|nr:serine/threonine protein kinase [Phycisphaerales bacterium]
MPEDTNWRRIFELAMAAPADQRGAVLDRECGGDAGLRRRLEAMITVTESEGDFAGATANLSPSPSTDTEATLDGGGPRPPAPRRTAELREGPGTKIGPYTLLKQIGEGGFGAVFMAEQEKPVQRRVALKIIKLGMDTGQVVARFEQERQALAMMDHPNIAKVLDAGATETGRPFFVMELCSGVPIVEYCDTNNLNIEERLELLSQVCNAVQHAHSKGIIHRDIKPTNILVSTQDGLPAAKVIDFGIAKATASKLTERTLFTEHRQLIGTPEYMSPEQAEGSLDIDTRTDVYSLGVLLYELLTGSTPFSGRELRSAAYADIQRIIREVDPPRPSTRLTQDAGALAAVAARRRTEPRRLGTMIRGELDWIVMKALEKDRARRYETANGLAMDIRRYLAGEPVLAAPPSTGYRLSKFIGRHRVTVSAGAAVAAALLVGVIAFAWQAKIARDQRDVAVLSQRAEADQRRIAETQRAEAAAQRDRAVAAETEAKSRADELAEVSEFQANMLSQIDAAGAGVALMADIRSKFAADLQKGGTPDADLAARAEVFGRDLARVNATDAAAAMIDRTILKPAITAIGDQFRDQPAVDASLRQTLATLYLKLGRNDDSEPLQIQALETRRRVLGELHPDTLVSLNALGILRHSQGKLAEAESIFREAMEKRARVRGAEHPDTLESTDNLGIVLQAAGRLDEAEQTLRKSLGTRRSVLGPENENTLTSLNNLGMTLQMQGKLAEAEQCYREATDGARRVIGEEDQTTLTLINNLGTILWTQGKIAEAEPYWIEALEKRRRVMGEDHPDTIAAINNMGTLRIAQNRKPEAEAYFRESLEKSRRVLGDDHPTTVQLISNLGSTLLMQGKAADAEPYLRSALETRRRTFGNDHQDTLAALNNLGSTLRDLGQLEEADALGAKAIGGARRNLPADHWLTAIFLSQHSRTLVKLNRYREAEQEGLEAYPIMVKTFGPAHERAVGVTKVLVEVYTAWDTAEPGRGYEAKAAEWKVKGETAPATAPASTPADAKPAEAK